MRNREHWTVSVPYRPQYRLGAEQSVDRSLSSNAHDEHGCVALTGDARENLGYLAREHLDR